VSNPATFANIHSKTSVGRANGPKPRVREVENEQCEGLPLGPHELAKRVERGRVVVECRWCGETWARLDAELRGTS